MGQETVLGIRINVDASSAGPASAEASAALNKVKTDLGALQERFGTLTAAQQKYVAAQYQAMQAAAGNSNAVRALQGALHGFNTTQIETLLTMGRVTDEAKKGAAGNESMFASFVKGAFVVDLAKQAMSALIGTYSEMKAATQALQQEQLRVDAVLTATGRTTEGLRERITALAAGMQQLTKFDDGAVMKAGAVLATFTEITGQHFERTIQLAGDLALVFGGDLTSRTEQLARALTEPAESLGQLERQFGKFSPTLKQQVKDLMAMNEVSQAQKLILDELAGRVGGAATAAYTGLELKVSATSKAYDSLLKAMGDAIFDKNSKDIGFLAEGMNTVTNIIQLQIPWWQKLNTAMSGVGGAAALANAANAAAAAPKPVNLRAMENAYDAAAEAEAKAKLQGAAEGMNKILEDTRDKRSKLNAELERINKLTMDRLVMAETPEQAAKALADMDTATAGTLRKYAERKAAVAKEVKDTYDSSAQWAKAALDYAMGVAKGELEQIKGYLDETSKAIEVAHKAGLLSDKDYWEKKAQLIENGVAAAEVALEEERQAIYDQQSELRDARTLAGNDAKKVDQINLQLAATDAKLLEIDTKLAAEQRKMPEAMRARAQGTNAAWEAQVRFAEEVARAVEPERQQLEALQLANAQWGLTPVQIAQANVAIAESNLQLAFNAKILDTDTGAWAANVEIMRQRVQIARDGVGAIQIRSDLEASTRATEAQTAAIRDMWQTTEQAAKSAWDIMVDGAGNTAQRLKDAFKRLFFDWIWNEFAKKQVMNLFISATGIGASQANAAGLFSGTGASGIGDLFGTISGSIEKLIRGTALGGVSGYGGEGDPGGFSPADRSLSNTSMAGLFERYFGQSGNVTSALSGIVLGLGVGGAIASALGHGDTHKDATAILSVVGTIVDLYFGGSGIIGGAVGGAVGGIFDSMNDGDAERTARIGQGSGDYTYGSAGGPFGDIGIERYSDKWFSDLEMGQTLRSWFQGISKLDREVARHFSVDEIARATAALSGQGMAVNFGLEHTSLDPETLSNIIRARFGTIFGVVDSQMAALVTNFKGSGEELITLVVDLATVHDRLTNLHAEFATLFGEDVSFAQLADLKGETEGYSEALQRLAGEYAVTNQIAQMLGKTQEEVWGTIGLASAGARARLVELAGGLDELSGQLDYYYTHFYTTAEQQAQTQRTLSQAFADAGVAMPLTIDGFREVTDRFLGMGEAGAEAAATMLALAPAFYAYIGAIEAVNTEISKNRAGFNEIFGEPISLEVVKRFQQNGEVLTDTLSRVTAEFVATNELLDMFGLDSATVFGAFGLSSEAARAHLIDLAGGLDAFSSKLNSFYGHYFTAEEQHSMSLARVQGVFDQLGITMPTTTKGMHDLMLEQLKLGPAGAAAVAALLDVGDEFYALFGAATSGADGVRAATQAVLDGMQQYIDFDPAAAITAAMNPQTLTQQWQATGTELRRVMALYDGSEASQQRIAQAVQNRYDTELQLVQAIAEALNGIKGLATDTIRSMTLQTLTPEQKYLFYDAEIVRLRAELANATDPAEIASLNQRIIQDISAAFNLLTPEEQAAKLAEFTARIDTISAEATARLESTGAAISAEHVSLPDSIKTAIETSMQKIAESMNTAADGMGEAAKDLKAAGMTYEEAAAAQMEAVTRFAKAVDTPTKVSVGISVQDDRVVTEVN